MRIFFNLIIAFLAAASFTAVAQEPPGRAGRLAFAEGSVSVYMDPDIGWEPAYVNVPLTSENSVWTDLDSRAELRVSGMSLRLDETSQLDVTELLDSRLDATLARGAVNVRIRHFLGNDSIAINTPQARFILQSEGRYRIDSDPDRGDSRITVFEGRASMETHSGRVSVPRGQSMVVWGSERPEYALQAPMTTDFDRWANTRDSQWVETQAPRYVSTYMTGYEDLDSHGEWVQEPDYGPLWFPARVSAEWAPYRYGHWAWVRPWGWTWIDDQPWGYAPFHYGRWVNVHNRWAWYPGHRVERPVYAPALVAWVGGSNWSVAVRGTAAPVVGWYALTPFERYQPWYRANTAYVNNVNVNVYITNRDRAWRHADEQRAVVRTYATVVQRDALASRRPVQQSIVQVAPEVMRQQTVTQQPTTMLPSRNDFVRANQGRAINRQGAPAATGTQPTQRGEPATPNATAAARATPGANPLARGAIVGGMPSAPPTIAPPAEKPRFARTPSAPAPQAAAAGATPPPPAPVTRAQPPGQERSRFGPGAAPPAPGTPPSAKGQQAIERRDTREPEKATRDVQQQQQQQQRAEQEKAARDAQQQQQQQQRGQQEKAARDAQQQQQQQRAEQEKAARDAQQQQQRGQQEKAARDAQQQQQQQRAEQEKAARESQQQQQRAQQEKAARDTQQQQQQRAEQEKAARESQQQQQQQQRAQQEKAARDAQQQQQQQQQRAEQEKAARESQQQQQQQQRAQQEKAARDAQQQQQQQQQRAQQEKAARDAQQQQQQQQQRAQQEKAARDAQQQQQQQQQRAQQEKAAREAQQQQQQKAQPQPAPPPQAQPQAQPQPQQKKPDKSDKSNKGDEEEKGKGNKP